MKHYFQSLPSTNTYLKEHYNSYNNFDTIIAINQTNGRGRFDRHWDNNNSIAMSILFKNNSYNHPIISSIAVCRVLRNLGLNALIKWPNDIYVDDLKISGILIESIYESNKKICDIVGIGINILKSNLYESIGISDYVNVDKDYIIDKVLEEYNKLLNESNLLDEYIKLSYVINKEIIYKNKTYRVIGIDSQFRLIIKDDLNTLYINSDEIKIILKRKE